MCAKRKIIIVDDSKTFRDGIKFYLDNILEQRVIGEATNGEEFLKLPNIPKADLILMDIEMPIMNGIEAARKILDTYPLKIIAITNYEEKAYLLELISVGFRGFISKKNIHQRLANCIEDVYSGKFVFPVDLKIDKHQ